jgi:hypothetical protein
LTSHKPSGDCNILEVGLSLSELRFVWEQEGPMRRGLEVVVPLPLNLRVWGLGYRPDCVISGEMATSTDVPRLDLVEVVIVIIVEVVRAILQLAIYRTGFAKEAEKRDVPL